MQIQTPQLPKELASNRNFDDYLLAMKINAIIRYLKAKESGLKIVANENDCCDKCHDVDYEKTYPAHTATFFCANKDCPCHESTHSEPKPTQCEMCQAVNELAPSLSYCPDHKYSVETTSSDEEVERIIEKFATEVPVREWGVLNKWLRSTLISFGKQQRDEGEKAGYRKGVEAALKESGNIATLWVQDCETLAARATKNFIYKAIKKLIGETASARSRCYMKR